VTKPIIVCGSLNMDFVVQLERLPRPGETLTGEGFRTLPGGKGANQACAAGRLGGRCRMVGRVGADVFGDQLRSGLAAAGVDVSGVMTTPGVASGVALICVQAGGQNMIVIASGANGCLVPSDLEILSGPRDGFLLLQLEVPIGTVEAAAVRGRSLGLSTILDPAPARPLPAGLLSQVDILTPNESEAMVLLNRPASEVSESEAPAVARDLRGLGPGTVILKMGAKGAWVDDGVRGVHVPGGVVDAVDATAAGDTFNGALSVALAEGMPLDAAVRFANAAAALSVTRFGAQDSIPTRSETDAFLKARGG
jgi:ribokinase